MNPTPKQVKKLRLYARLLQREFAELLGRSRDTVICWESGEREMDLDLFEVACMKLKLDKKEFLDVS